MLGLHQTGPALLAGLPGLQEEILGLDTAVNALPIFPRFGTPADLPLLTGLPNLVTMERKKLPDFDFDFESCLPLSP
jgi:hypothetical protein